MISDEIISLLRLWDTFMLPTLTPRIVGLDSTLSRTPGLGAASTSREIWSNRGARCTDYFGTHEARVGLDRSERREIAAAVYGSRWL